MSFGQRVKERRVALGLTQEALADVLNVGQRYISKVETGETANPTLETIRAFARVLNLDVLELLEPSSGTSDRAPLQEVA